MRTTPPAARRRPRRAPRATRCASRRSRPRAVGVGARPVPNPSFWRGGRGGEGGRLDEGFPLYDEGAFAPEWTAITPAWPWPCAPRCPSEGRGCVGHGGAGSGGGGLGGGARATPCATRPGPPGTSPPPRLRRRAYLRLPANLLAERALARARAAGVRPSRKVVVFSARPTKSATASTTSTSSLCPLCTRAPGAARHRPHQQGLVGGFFGLLSPSKGSKGCQPRLSVSQGRSPLVWTHTRRRVGALARLPRRLGDIRGDWRCG
jgi:hypothetical protein